MNFPLEVNEQLAKAIRTAVAFKIEVEKINGIASKKEIVIAESSKKYEKMSDTICEMICTIGSDIGAIIQKQH